MQINILLERGADMNQVAQQAAAVGFVLEHRLEAVGVMVGQAPSEALDKLRAIRGIVSIESSGDVKIPPPGSPVQ